jgi:hypothetical protein
MKQLLLMTLVIPAIAAAQPAPGETGAQHMVRAAGMPLNDGSIPPGMLTVRIVEGAFTRDIADVQVDVEVAGGKIESVVTGADGRAGFAHLPIGAQVRATATVGGERLQSDAFQIPAQSGVRVLLVTGAGAAPDAAASAPVVTATAGTVRSTDVALAPGRSDDATRIAVIRAVLATATLSAFAYFAIGRWRRHP